MGEVMLRNFNNIFIYKEIWLRIWR